ncbi:MAG: 2-phosphosulfolactate phosphatase [Bacteroidales bacterium]|nr:2-phosphosulfolactate phosphatase [Bacteroidales bacterium]
MNSIEVCLSPALFKYKTTTDNFIVVIIDVLRATTAFCAAFDSGAKSVIPVSGLEELLEYKNKGYLTAAERDGNKVDFADFGNSPTVFLNTDLNGKELAYSTTNGTQAVEIAKNSGNIAVAAFVNLKAMSEWIIGQQKNVVILCSGWKNTFSLEDTLCAGALVGILEQSGLFNPICDASGAALALWQSSKNDLQEVVKKANHYQRLVKLGQLVDLQHCFQINTSEAVPVWNGKAFLNRHPSI